MNRGRWQPPHPDPDRLPTPSAQTRRRDAKHRLLCTWFECPELADSELGIPLCFRHAIVTVRAVNRATSDILAEKQQHLDDLEAATRKLDDGQTLNADEPVPGWIYYILNGDTIKIGYANDVTQRMRAYPPNVTLLAVEPGTRTLERARHRLFHAHLAHGREWFRDNPEIRAWIDTLRTQHGAPDAMTYTYTAPRKEPVVAGRRINNRRW